MTLANLSNGQHASSANLRSTAVSQPREAADAAVEAAGTAMEAATLAAEKVAEICSGDRHPAE